MWRTTCHCAIEFPFRWTHIQRRRRRWGDVELLLLLVVIIIITTTIRIIIKSKSSLTWLHARFHPRTVCATSTIRLQLLQTSPLCPNDGMSIRCHKLFLPPSLPRHFSLLHATPVTPFPPLTNMGPSGCLLIYKCLCVLKCGTKGTGLWPLGVPTLCRFIVRRWERGFGTETPGHWPTHIPEQCHSCAQRCMSPRSSHCFSGNNSFTLPLSLCVCVCRERKQLSNFPLNVAWCKPRQTLHVTPFLKKKAEWKKKCWQNDNAISVRRCCITHPCCITALSASRSRQRPTL